MERMKQGMICGGNNQGHIMYVFLLIWFQIQIKKCMCLSWQYTVFVYVKLNLARQTAESSWDGMKFKMFFFYPSYSVMFFARGHAASGPKLYTALAWTVMFPPCWKEHQIDVRIAMTIIYPVAEHHGTSYTHRKSNIDTKCDGFLRLYLLSNVFFWYPFFSFRSDRRETPDIHPLDGQSSPHHQPGCSSSGFYFTQTVDGLALTRCLWKNRY